MPGRDDDNPSPARLEEAFKGLRELNRREHDWIGRDIEDLRKDFMALRERIADAEPVLAEVVRLQAQTARQADHVSAQWPQWVLAGAAVVAALLSLWSMQRAPPDTATLVAAIEQYEAQRGARR